MVSSSSDFPQKSLQIKKDDKFFSRIVSKEGSSMANNNNPSFRIYYGGVSGAVPFMWESQPGTPKHTLFSDTSSLPPLTPPPSYQFNSNKKPNKNHSSRSTLLHTLFPRLNSTNKQSHVSPSSPSSLSLSSSWSSSTTSSMSVKKKRGRFSSSARSSFDSMMDEYEEEPSFESSHTSTLCFGFSRETNNGGGGGGGGLRGGCSYSAMSMKKAFLSIVGQGSKLRY